MPEPTGNRWRDPDTGEIANPKNIQPDTFRGRSAVASRLGPAVRENGPDAEPASPEDPITRARRIEADALARAGVTAPPAARVPRAPDIAGDLQEIRPQLGPAFAGTGDREDDPNRPELASPVPRAPRGPPASPAIDDEYEQALAALQEHGPRARQGEAESTAILNELAEQEYRREDGGRAPITKRLAAFGIRRPRSDT